MSVQATDLTHDLIHLTSHVAPQNIIFILIVLKNEVCCRMHLMSLALQVDTILHMTAEFGFELLKKFKPSIKKKKKTTCVSWEYNRNIL